MDSMDLEREKGITIQSAATFVTWGDHHQLDRHPRARRLHDRGRARPQRARRRDPRAVLGGGVQSQSITVDRQMRRYNVPAPRVHQQDGPRRRDAFKVTRQLREKLRHNAVLVTYPIGAEDKFEGVVDLLTREALYFDGDNGETIRKEPCPEHLKAGVEEYRLKLVEALGDFDDALAEAFLEEGAT
jgi:elongation factor G